MKIGHTLLSSASRRIRTRSLQAYLGHKNIQHTVKYTELAPVGSGISDTRSPLQDHGKPAVEPKSLADQWQGFFATVGLAHQEVALDRLVLAAR
jgi:hypothetical protein